MRNKVQLIITMFVALGFYQLHVATSAYACSCTTVEAPAKELELRDAVFSGRVISIFPNPDGGPLKRKGENSAILEVATTWKGVSKSQVIVSRGMAGGPCEMAVSIGQSLLVYGAVEQDGTISTSNCTRTKLLSEASADLVALGGGKTVVDKVDLVREYSRVEQHSTEGSNELIMWALVTLITLTFASVLLMVMQRKKRYQAE